MPMSAKVDEALAIHLQDFSGVYRKQFTKLAQTIRLQAMKSYERWKTGDTEGGWCPNWMIQGDSLEDSWTYVINAVDFIISRRNEDVDYAEFSQGGLQEIFNQIFNEARQGVTVIMNPVRILPEYQERIDVLFNLMEVLVIEYGRVLQIATVVNQFDEDDLGYDYRWYKYFILDWCQSYKTLARNTLSMISIVLQHVQLQNLDTLSIVSTLLKVFNADTCMVTPEEMAKRISAVNGLGKGKYLWVIQEVQAVAREIRTAVNYIHASKYPSTWAIPLICKYVRQIYPASEMGIVENWARGLAQSEGLSLAGPSALTKSLRAKLITNQLVDSVKIIGG